MRDVEACGPLKILCLEIAGINLQLDTDVAHLADIVPIVGESGERLRRLREQQ